MPDSTRAALAAQALWGDADLLVTLYSDGRNHLLMIQPPHNGQIPPPHIGTMAYMGEYHPSKVPLIDGSQHGQG